MAPCFVLFLPASSALEFKFIISFAVCHRVLTMNSQKRKRNVNFSKAEEELLVEQVMKRKEIIENKKTEAVMWNEKEAIWKELTSEFNSVGLLVHRTTEQLQLKYKSLKKQVRKKNAKIMSVMMISSTVLITLIYM
uniref:Regulatory protein zeste n=1 Tax=Lygus hesperus TaxID=30085 RepID=A0A0K8T4X2_LYGHE